MYRDERIAYGLLALSALGFYFIVIPWQIEEPDWVTMSPAFLPRICTALVLVLALYKLVSSFRLGHNEFRIGHVQYLRLFLVLLILAVATYAMYVVGFWISLLVALVPLQLVAGQRNPLILVAFAAALVGTSWFLLDLAGLHIVAPY